MHSIKPYGDPPESYKNIQYLKLRNFLFQLNSYKVTNDFFKNRGGFRAGLDISGNFLIP